MWPPDTTDVHKVLLALAAVVTAFAVSLDGDQSSLDDGKSADSVAAEAWPGWRGLSAEGRVYSGLPTSWSVNDGIRWKTAIPGRGHSSPIVFGDRIYVTTAYVTSSGVLLQDAARFVTRSLMVIVAALSLGIVIRRCDPRRSPTTADLGAGIFIVTAIFLLAVIAYGGDPLFDFARCNIRGWIASTVFASGAFALVAAASHDKRRRLAVAAGAIVLAAFVLIAFPSKGFAFRGGPSSLRMQISIAASALPLVVGLGTAFLACSWPRRSRWIVLAGAVSVLVTVGALLVQHLLVFRDDSFPATTYVPQLNPWLLLLAATASATAWFVRRACGATLSTNVAVVLCSAASVVLIGVVALEFLATRSPYLAYQIGTPSFDLRPSDALFWSAGAALLIGAVRRTPRGSGPVWSAHLRISSLLAIATLVLSIVVFVHVNYIHGQSRMVRAIVALDRDSGEPQWTLQGLDAVPPVVDGRNSPATPTPVTDGNLVCAYFGTPGLMCGDTDGGLAWSRSDLGYDGFYGVGFSPVLARGMLVVASDTPEGVARVHALDARTGESRWTRTFSTTPTITGNNRTPIVRTINDRSILILWGMHYVKGLALDSGEQLWSYEHMSDGDLVSSPISDAERLYLASKAGTVALDYASLLDGRDPLRWRSTARANCVSPVLVNGMLFTVTDAGIAAAIDAASGETLWRQRLPGEYFASLLASPDAVYFTNSDGVTTVVAAEPAFRIIAQNDLGESTMASMAAARGALFIRAGNSLYAIARP